VLPAGNALRLPPVYTAELPQAAEAESLGDSGEWRAWFRCRSAAASDSASWRVAATGRTLFWPIKGQKRVRRPWRKTLVAKGLRHPTQLLLMDESIVEAAKRLKQHGFKFHRWRRAYRRAQAAFGPGRAAQSSDWGPSCPTASLRAPASNLVAFGDAAAPCSRRGGIGLSHGPARRLRRASRFWPLAGQRASGVFYCWVGLSHTPSGGTGMAQCHPLARAVFRLAGNSRRESR